MNKLLTGLGIGVALALSSAGGASADGMPGARRAPVAQAPCALGRFQGLYIGANLGSAYHDWRTADRDAYAKTTDDDLPSSVAGSTSGFIGGGQIGYNWQNRCTVFGVEADFTWAGLRQNKTFLEADNANPDRISYSSELNWFGTLRTKTGIVVDNLMFYVTGGFAYADFERRFNLAEPSNAPPIGDTGGASRTRWGYVAGIGTEWAWTNNISITGEASYIRFADWSSTHSTNFHIANNAAQRSSFGFDHQDSIWVGRMGLNFKIGNF